MSNELRTLVSLLFPPVCAVNLTEVTVEQASVQLQLTATVPAACCPDCTVPSSSIRSRYQCHPTDLHWATRAVRLQLMVVLARFARGLQDDLPAIKAGPRSNGATV
jgi:hypothetical protein